MDRPGHTIRLMGPYAPEDDARTKATRMAEIQTAAWEHWLSGRGVSREIIESSVWSDVESGQHMDAREARLREAFGRNDQGEAVLYFGAFAASGDMVGFAKFLISTEEVQAEAAEAFEQRPVFLLAEIDVLPEYQGRKAADPADHLLAKKMIYSAIAAVRHPKAILRLGVLEHNTRARTLYQGLGLTDTGFSSFDFEDNENRVVNSEIYISMEGSLHEAREILREQLELTA